MTSEQPLMLTVSAGAALVLRVAGLALAKVPCVQPWTCVHVCGYTVQECVYTVYTYVHTAVFIFLLKYSQVMNKSDG